MSDRDRKIAADARQAADAGQTDSANPYRPGSREYYAWNDGYRDARRASGRPVADGTPPGTPAWG